MKRNRMFLMTVLLSVSGCAYDVPNTADNSSQNPGGQASADLTCIPGQAAFCACPSGNQGVQTCSSAGFYSACDCSAPIGPGADTSGTQVDTSTGADSTPTPTAPVDNDWTATCLSGQYWDNTSDGGDDDDDHKDSDGELEGSSRMTPGQDCITCHRRDDEGPTYAAAGTVFLGYHGQFNFRLPGRPSTMIQWGPKLGRVRIDERSEHDSVYLFFRSDNLEPVWLCRRFGTGLRGRSRRDGLRYPILCL